MKILVTGAAGYIGSVLVGELLDHGHDVWALDDLSSRSDSLVRYSRSKGFTFLHVDIARETTSGLQAIVAESEAIVHLAAVVGMPACDREPERARAVNVEATRLLMQLRSPAQRLVFPNTNSGYGTTPPGTVCTEKTPMAPVSLYGRLKCEAEEHVLAGENTVSLRLATVFGFSPRMRRDLLVNDFVWRGLKDRRIDVYEGRARRNFVHVRDVARALRKCATGTGDARVLSGVYNFGNDTINLSKRALADRVASHMAAVVTAVDGVDPDRRDYVVSSKKLRGLPIAGIEASLDLDEGIRELIAGYRCLPELYT